MLAGRPPWPALPFTPAERQSMHATLPAARLDEPGCGEAAHPHAVLVSGLPGAGKSHPAGSGLAANVR